MDLTTPGPHENILGDPGFLPGDDIAQSVPNEDGILQVDGMLGGCLEDQAGLGLAAGGARSVLQ